MKAQPHETRIRENSQLPFFKERGYLVVSSLFSKDYVNQILSKIQNRLNHCAQDLCCSYEEYLEAVSRWVDPSPITIGFDSIILNPLKIFIDSLMGEVCDLVKINVISKTRFASSPVPFHQDIAYSPNTPYQFSAWLALTDAPLQSGPLEVIVGSHRGEIEPAVDFWVPDYKDLNTLKQGIQQKLPVNAGDLIVFDSCLWHGSGESQSANERFALVTRWKTKNYVDPFVPSIKPKPFGMWTCQKETEKILAKNLKIYFGEKASNYLDLLYQWEEILGTIPLSFLKDHQKAKKDLSCVRILHLAHRKHNGGDAQGKLYARLWDSLLKPLSS